MCIQTEQDLFFFYNIILFQFLEEIMTKKFRPKELDVASRSNLFRNCNLFRNFMQHHHRCLRDIYYSSGYT